MKIAWLSDWDLIGSGYLNISAPLCQGLVKRGHEIKAVGLGYKGNEHHYDFGIIPAKDIREALQVSQNIFSLWKFDMFVSALDITIQEVVLKTVPTRTFGYIGITPVEADPLCISWAMTLMQMDKTFIISQFGTDEAKKVGVEAEHLQVGVDTELWSMPTEEDKQSLRKSYGIDKDAFVVLTIADNQERKNLSRSMQIFANFAKKVPNSRYILVTRENNFVGWKLQDLAQQLKINTKFNIYERGMPSNELWNLYAISDVFLLTSKAEGLGMPLLEAMACGVPCLATNCTAISELLADGRGILIDHEHQSHPERTYIDPFGNGHRYFADLKDGTNKLLQLYEMDRTPIIQKSRDYVESRNWGITIEQMERALEAARKS